MPHSTKQAGKESLGPRYSGPWVVVWRGYNTRTGSRPLRELPLLQAVLCMSLLQQDTTGTEHWYVSGPSGYDTKAGMAYRERIARRMEAWGESLI